MLAIVLKCTGVYIYNFNECFIRVLNIQLDFFILFNCKRSSKCDRILENGSKAHMKFIM